MTAYEQNNRKGIVVVFTTILLVLPCLISGLQLKHVIVVVVAAAALANGNKTTSIKAKITKRGT